MVRPVRAPSSPLTVRRKRDGAWQLAAKFAARLLATHLRRGLHGAAAYLHGSLAAGDGRFGYSDIDLCVVVPDHPTTPGTNRRIVQDRWRRLRQRSSLLARAVDLMSWEDAELRRAVCSSRLTCRCRREGRGTSSQSEPSGSALGGQAGSSPLLWLRPGLYGPMSRWQLLSGPERRPVLSEQARPDRWEAAWTELQFWCRHAFRAAADPRTHSLPYLSAKLVIEPVRVWLWAAHGICAERRGEVLERGVELLPEEAQTLQWAGRLPRSIPAAQLEPTFVAALRCFFRLSQRLAERLALEARGWRTVQLVGAREEGADSDSTPPWQALVAERARLPLVDWVARTWPLAVEEWCMPHPGDPADPSALRAAMAVGDTGLYPLLRTEELLVMPVAQLARATRRAMQCRVTDPVTFALAAGSGTAEFPELPGWSVSDCARRAMDEHGDQLALRGWCSGADGAGAPRDIGTLVTAARAALFLQSVSEGAPRLAVTVEAVVAELAEVDPTAGALAGEAVAGYRARCQT